MNENPSAPEALLANPYASPNFSAPQSVASIQRPSGLTVMGVLCIVGGLVGILAGLLTLLNLFFGAAIATAITPSGPQQQIQQEMNQQIQAVASRYFVANLISSVGSFAVGIRLLAGGIGIFRQPPKGRTWLRKVLLLAIAVECLKTGIYVMMQIDMLPIIEQFVQRMATRSGGGLGSATMGKMMTAMTLVGFGIWLLWSVVKLGLYLWGRAYLKRPKIIAFFGSTND